ncbi:MAG: hypothetical protein AB1553_01890 [Nitrospirota bacterium]
MAKIFRAELIIQTEDEVTESELNDAILAQIDGEDTIETGSRMILNESTVTFLEDVRDEAIEMGGPK